MADDEKNIDQPKAEPAAEEKTFTEEQVNAIVQDRLARAKKKTADRDAELEELGGLEAIKKLIEEQKAKEDAEKSELERLTDQLANAQKQLDDAISTNRTYELEKKRDDLIPSVLKEAGIDLLPRTYMQTIKLHDDEAEQKEAIKKVVEIFQLEVGALKKPAPKVSQGPSGGDEPPEKTKKEINTPGDLKDIFKGIKQGLSGTGFAG